MNLRDKSTILIYGGTFDPPHVAHVILPMLAMEVIGADCVAYIPAAQAPHKQRGTQTDVKHRLAMLKLALAETRFATILMDEMDRAAMTGDPSYTVDTLEGIRARIGPGPVLRLLIGADMLRIFDTWKEPARIVELAEPVVMVRPPDSRASLLAALPKGFNKEEWASRLVDQPLLHMSATMIRERVARGLPISGFVHPAVERYIVQQGLYALQA
ncbi:MAG: nicotinate (nicotinamide) nucleotide adenylyltransferase [Phycisphaeraceae bacterium]